MDGLMHYINIHDIALLQITDCIRFFALRGYLLHFMRISFSI